VDFEETEEEIAFRKEARAWLDGHAPRRVAGEQSDRSYMPGDGDPDADVRHLNACKEWQHTLFNGGWAGITWPVEAGGRGGAGWQQRIFNEEQSKYDVAVGAFAVGIGMAGPTIIAWGSPEQQARYLPPMLRGDEVWCQLFSEPGAGSDLAGLRTRAERDGDEWIVNGQKVWTSGAHYSDWGLLLARSNPDAPKHKGITAFLLDMRTPGIDVRPLRQITGASHFNEVFLTDVQIPESCVVGPVDGGWRVANTMLSNERALIGSGGRVGFRDLIALAQRTGAASDPLLRQDLARSYTRLQLIKWLGLRARSRKDQGLGPEASVLKLAASRRLEYDGDLVLALQGAPALLFDEDALQHGYWQQQFLGQWSSRLGGGTEQIQRNVIGERVLGLPGEPRLDKELPFRDLPSS
jgi:alkylation response protein AidB-like acyl-CoA dehydrogenase